MWIGRRKGSHTSITLFSCGSSILVKLEFGELIFCGGREKLQSRLENQQQT